MDNSIPEQRSGSQQQGRYFAGPQFVDRILNWLARLVQFTHLTDEERKDAGIYLDD